MTNGILSKHIGMIAVGSGLLAVSVYLSMINVTLAHLESVSGHAPFDMRPFGYSPADAATILDTLGVDGREYYLRHQIPRDTLYPALLALTLTATICWFGQRMPNSTLVRHGVALSVGSAVFDYIENLSIMAMIWRWPDVSAPLVYAASTATIIKSVITTLAVLLVFLIGFIWSRWPKVGLRQ